MVTERNRRWSGSPVSFLCLLAFAGCAGPTGGIPKIANLLETARSKPLAGKKARLTAVANSGRVAVGVLQIAKGAGVPPHYHAWHDELVYVIRGRGVMQLGQRKKEIGPGDLVAIPQRTVHGVRITETMTVLRMMSPPDDPKEPDRVPVR